MLFPSVLAISLYGRMQKIDGYANSRTHRDKNQAFVYTRPSERQFFSVQQHFGRHTGI
jgi:hypothetical protein